MLNKNVDWRDIPCETDFYLTGGTDYLILKEPVKIERMEDGYHVQPFGITAPLSSSPKEIAKRISNVYKELEHKAAIGQLNGGGPEFEQWRTVCELVDRKGMLLEYERTHPHRELIEIRAVRKGQGRSLVRPSKSAYKVSKSLRKSLFGLPLGFVEADVTEVGDVVIGLDNVVLRPDYF